MKYYILINNFKFKKEIHVISKVQEKIFWNSLMYHVRPALREFFKTIEIVPSEWNKLKSRLNRVFLLNHLRAVFDSQ